MTEHNSEALAYFISLLEQDPADTGEYSVRKWDQRARLWKKEREKNRKNDERVASACAYLDGKGLLQEDFDIADIGCGPGRFAAAFARRVRRVVGLDISSEMTSQGMEYIHSQGLTNARLYTCDFQTLDIEKEGFRSAFDLVFASMTPALHSMDGLRKAMEMSRAWCCCVTHLNGTNDLRDQIAEEVFGKKPSHQWTGRWFYSLFNVLFLSGYNPETSYESRHQERWIHPDEEYVEYITEHMLPKNEITKENTEKILDWLKAHENQDGLVCEMTDHSYGRILWDVRAQKERPHYHTGKEI